jgi:HEAT repeat protein
MKMPIDNEPAPPIPGGSRRASYRIDRTELPILAARERVLTALRAHDPDSRGQAAATWQESDFPLLRAIAQEGAISNGEPAIRYNAIAALPSSSAAADMNLLIDLAHFGEDFYVRGHALLALGSTGLTIALPALAAHLGAVDAFERSAAKQAIALIAQRTSVESVRAHASHLSAEVRAEVERAAAELRKPRTREPRTTPQRKDPAR